MFPFFRLTNATDEYGWRLTTRRELVDRAWCVQWRNVRMSCIDMVRGRGNRCGVWAELCC